MDLRAILLHMGIDHFHQRKNCFLIKGIVSVLPFRIDKDHAATLQSFEIVRDHALLKFGSLADLRNIFSSPAEKINDL